MFIVAFLSQASRNFIDIFNFVEGPTSYAPVVEAAIDIVEKSGGQYHVLVIIADGQVSSEALFSIYTKSCVHEHKQTWIHTHTCIHTHAHSVPK